MLFEFVLIEVLVARERNIFNFLPLPFPDLVLDNDAVWFNVTLGIDLYVEVAIFPEFAQ